MKRILSLIIATILICMTLTPVAFASDMRWKNVAYVSVDIDSSYGTYESEIQGNKGTSKIVCTLVLYEKNLWGTYKQVSQTKETYYGRDKTFVGTYNFKSGTTYKLVSTATVTCNGVAETVSASTEKKC